MPFLGTPVLRKMLNCSDLLITLSSSLLSLSLSHLYPSNTCSPEIDREDAPVRSGEGQPASSGGLVSQADQVELKAMQEFADLQLIGRCHIEEELHPFSALCLIQMKQFPIIEQTFA